MCAEILPRPPFPFGGAWLLAAGVTIHIIDRDPEFETGQLPLAEARRDARNAERVLMIAQLSIVDCVPLHCLTIK